MKPATDFSACAKSKEDIVAISIGQQAPDFELTSDEQKQVRLSDFRGKKVILYFYPKAGTSG